MINELSKDLSVAVGIPWQAHPTPQIRRRFTDLTGLSFDEYYNYITGFDVVKLAALIDPEDQEGISLNEICEDRWGKPAAELIEALLHYPKLDPRTR